MTNINASSNATTESLKTFVSELVFESLDHALISSQLQDSVYSKIDDTLRQKFKNKKMYKRARRYLSLNVGIFNKLNNTNFTIPASPILLERKPPEQIISDIINAKSVSVFIKKLRIFLLTNKSFDIDESAGFFLISLVIYNAVYSKAVIEHVFSNLSSTINLIKFLDQELIINANINNSSFGNTRVSENTVSYNYTVVLHNITKAWLLRLKKLNKISNLNVKTAQECVKLAIDRVDTKSGINLTNLVKYSHYSCQFLNNSKLDQFAINILKRKFDNSSCNDQQLKIYERKYINPSNRIDLNYCNSSALVSNLSSYDKNYINNNIGYLFNIIKQKDYIDLLIKELNYSTSQLIFFIILWMLIKSRLNTEQLIELSKRYNSYFNKTYNFSKADLRPIRSSSLRTYFSTFVRNFIRICKNRNLLQFSKYEYEDVYDQILHQKKSSRRAAASQRLIEFHQILVRYCDAPIVQFDQFSNFRICKTEMIPPFLFDAFLKSIKLSNSLSLNDKNTLCVMYILSYRLALRINEILHLYISDFAIMQNSNIHVVIKKHGDKNQKSSSAHRTILLSAFLTKDEILQFLHVYSNRKRQCDQKNVSYRTQLFLRSDSLHYTEQELNSHLQSFFRPLYPNNITFHTLRHSCINHLFLVLRQSALVKHFTDYSLEQQLKIRYALTQSRNTQQNYYELAFLAGHLEPTTTAASYLHLLDLEYTFAISKLDYCFTRQHYINIIKTQNDDVKLYMSDLSKYLFSHLYVDQDVEKKLKIALPNSTVSPRSENVLGSPNCPLTFDILHYYVYSEIQELNIYFNTSIDEIYKLRKTAEYLKKHHLNNKKTPVLFNTDYLKRNPHTLIGPLPKTKSEKNVFKICEKNYENVHLNLHDDLMKFFEIYLRKVNSTDSRFIFSLNEKFDLRVFIKITHLLFGSEFITIQTNAKNIENISYIIEKYNIQNMSIDSSLDSIVFNFKPRTSQKALGVFKICVHLLLIFNNYRDL